MGAWHSPGGCTSSASSVTLRATAALRRPREPSSVGRSAMRSFAELLREYTARTGVSDAELARALGVRRQTIFRWKEGLTERPRRREDVQRCADKLRLSPDERGQLLLAAGFAPEQAPPLDGRPAEAAEHSAPDVPSQPEASAPEAARFAPPSWGRHARRRFVRLLAGLLVLLVAAAASAVSGQRPAYPAAAPGETLVLVGALDAPPVPTARASGTRP